MHFAIVLLTFVLGAYYARIRRFPTRQQMVAYVLAVNAVAAGWTGFYLAMEEDARSRYGHVGQGIVSERISSTGELGTRVIGLSSLLRRTPGYDPLRTINTGQGSQFYEAIARQIATGSIAMWVVDYSYDCGRPRQCWGRDFLTHARWLQLPAGSRVTVRYVSSGLGGQRLEDNPQWTTAITEMAIAAVLLLGVAAVSGALPSVVRRVHRLETLAVVTGVERVQHGPSARWRVRFSYLDDLGGSREATDEFAVDQWKVGDTGMAVYDVADPDFAGLRRFRPGEATN